MSEFRTETDSLGDVQVPGDALWGAQTQRAVENFPVSSQPMPQAFIAAVAQIKRAAAEANTSLGLLDNDLRDAIAQACEDIVKGEYADQFPVDRYQTGSGTSTNMNVNEVIASIARNAGFEVHPNDHVNMSQSSNDVIPTAIHVSAVIAAKEKLLPALSHLCGVIYEQEAAFSSQVKTGRTHLMDAMPVTLGQELKTWREQLLAVEKRVEAAADELLAVPQGGTAVGTGINALPEFSGQFVKFLRANTGYPFTSLDHKFIGQSAVDAPVALSAQLRGAAIVLTKIANDLRWMNSGPIHGLAEISLPALQPGSSIMPGKVNPVICEAVVMAACQVIGNDAAVTTGGLGGVGSLLDLNVAMPMMAANVLDSIQILSGSCTTLNEKLIQGLEPDEERCAELIEGSLAMCTSLVPVIGYDASAKLAYQAYAEGKTVRELALEQGLLDADRLNELLDPRSMTEPGE